MHAELERFERALAGALREADPAAAFERLARGTELPEDLRARLAAVDADGVRIAGLLVARLRFERLLQGSRRVADWFESDPRAFTDAFRAYHAEVPPREPFPAGEAARFETWLEGRGGPGDGTRN